MHQKPAIKPPAPTPGMLKQAEALGESLLEMIEQGKQETSTPETQDKLRQVAASYQKLSKGLRKARLVAKQNP